MNRSAIAARSAFLAITAAAVFATMPAEAAMRDFVGRWVNTDRDTSGLTRLVISRQGGQLRVRGFGQCSPRDCDWGRARLNLFAPSANGPLNRNAKRATATFRQGFKSTLLTLTLVNDRTIRFCTYNNFTDGSGRADYFSCGNLKKRAAARPRPGRPGRPGGRPWGQPRTLSTGALVIPQTYLADLDSGQVTQSGADIWFEADTATRRFVTPRNGARIAIAGDRSIGRDGCRDLDLGTQRINIRDLPVGTYVCVRTNEGRISQFRVNAPVGRSPGKLRIGYTTWEKPGD